VEPSTPIQAATIIIGRDIDNSFEMFMVVRHHQIDFAAGALVFPGGKVDVQDNLSEIRDYCDGAEGLDDNDLSLHVAAIRETYEESGILLARSKDEKTLISKAKLAELSQYQDDLNQKKTTVLEFVKAENLRLSLGHITRFAHWITPEIMPKRFDTHFFLATAPTDQVAEHDGSESVDSTWITPQTALDDCEACRRMIVFPTKLNIMKLAKSNCISQAIETAKSSEIVTVFPWIEERESGTFLCIQQNAGYDIVEESLDALFGKKEKMK